MEVLDLLRTLAAAALLTVACGFLFVGAMGALHLKDAYSRLHAVRLATGLGAPLFLVALAVAAWTPFASIGLLALALFGAAVGPSIAHLMANAVYDVARAHRSEET
jgi:monovalent cation/proton antiporter MnhG/PhaG subunit